MKKQEIIITLAFSITLIALIGASLHGFTVKTKTIADWPQFQHDYARSGYTTEHGSAINQLKWVFWPRAGVSTPPIISSAVIYFGTNQMGPLTTVQEDYINHQSSGDNRNTLFAVNVDTGQEIWKYRVNSPITGVPAVHGDILMFGSRDRNVYALDKYTGSLRYSFRIRDAPLNSPILIWQNKAFFIDAIGQVYAVDVASGGVLWSVSSITSDSGYVSNYFQAGWGDLVIDDETNLLHTGLVSINPNTGEILNSYEENYNRVTTQSGMQQLSEKPRRLIILDTLDRQTNQMVTILIVATINFNPSLDRVIAFDVESGRVLWQLGIHIDKPFSAVGNQLLLARSQDILIIDVATGSTLSTIQDNDPAGVAISGNGLAYIKNRNYLRAIHSNGQIAWSSSLPSTYSHAPAVADGNTYVSTLLSVNAFGFREGVVTPAPGELQIEQPRQLTPNVKVRNVDNGQPTYQQPFSMFSTSLIKDRSLTLKK